MYGSFDKSWGDMGSCDTVVLVAQCRSFDLNMVSVLQLCCSSSLNF